ncbi:MAG: hypothetical protein NT011_12685 [Kiritimatiellaeota bacterium]|nr:hypothetical protein [Kiritimatiellota bacterium]
MNKLFQFLFVGLIVGSNGLTAFAAVTIPFTDSNISKYGRYIDDAIGANLTWSGSWMRFKVSGTTNIRLNVQVNLSSNAVGQLQSYIDGAMQPDAFAIVPATNQDQTVTLVRGLTPGEHTVVVQVGEWLAHSPLVSSNEYIKIKNIIIDDGGTLSAWPQTGTYHMLFLGDSWAGDGNSVTRFFNPDRWTVWTVGFGGFQAGTMNTYYPYKAAGVAHTDPPQDLCVIQYGVNDYFGKVATATFKSNVQSIMDKVVADHSGIKFFLVQVPANGTNYYDKYGTVLSELAAENTNTYYISTTAIASNLTWNGAAHIAAASRDTIYTPYLDAQISSYWAGHGHYVTTNGGSVSPYTNRSDAATNILHQKNTK